MLNLALHQADVIVDMGTLEVVENVGVIARRGEARLVHGQDVERFMRITTIEEVEHERVYRLAGPEGVWLLRRTGGCRTCLSTTAWPLNR